MGCRQCDMITTPKRRPIVFDRKESYGRYTSQSYLNHRLPHRCVLLSAGKAPDHPRAILHQIRRPDCGTAKGILYSHSPAIKTEKERQQMQNPCTNRRFCQLVQGFSSQKITLQNQRLTSATRIRGLRGIKCCS